MLAGLTRLATVQADASYGSPTSERPSGMSWMSTENMCYTVPYQILRQCHLLLCVHLITKPFHSGITKMFIQYQTKQMPQS